MITITWCRWCRFNSHPRHTRCYVLGKALYDNFLCLVVSNKQQIQW